MKAQQETSRLHDYMQNSTFIDIRAGTAYVIYVLLLQKLFCLISVVNSDPEFDTRKQHTCRAEQSWLARLHLRGQYLTPNPSPTRCFLPQWTCKLWWTWRNPEPAKGKTQVGPEPAWSQEGSVPLLESGDVLILTVVLG